MKLLLLLSFWGSLAFSEQKKPILICTSKAMTQEWNDSNDKFISAIMTNAKIDFKIKRLPLVREVKMFENGLCDIVTSTNESLISKSKKYLRIEESLYSVDLVLYASHPASAKLGIKSFADLSKIDHKDSTIAYPRSPEIKAVFSILRQAKTIPLTEMKQGFKMLELGRVNYFLVPEVDYFKDEFHKEKEKLTSVATLYTGDLYWWTGKENQDLAQKLQESIRETKRKISQGH